MATNRTDIVSRSLEVDVRNIDKNVKNPWRWQWLEKEINGKFLRETIRKLQRSGAAYCLACQREINYGSRGFVALADHVKSLKHLSGLQLRTEHSALPGAGSSSSDGSYGLHPMFTNVTVAPPKLPEPLTSINDRNINSESMLVAFLAEKSLPFSLAPDILELTKALARDKKVLGQMKMHRTAASYKLQYGLAKTFQEKLAEDVKKNFFSLNIDESTSNNFQKIVTVLVNIPNENREIVTKHLSSFSIIKGNADSIFQGILKIFEENDIPWDNLISVLLDSCNVMRGVKGGLETKLRSKCPHLIDIGGDTCHHAHNAAKRFCKPFEMYLEALVTDIHNDLKWSSDLREALMQICEAVNITYTLPQSFVSFRWLSVYDSVTELQRMFAALTLFYFSFLTKEDKSDFLHIIVKIYKNLNVSDLSRDAIRNIQENLAKKNMTEQGEKRKCRIMKKLFDSQIRTKLIMGLFTSVLPLLKDYVLLFQSSKPLIHILYEKQWNLLKNFLSCFLKPEVLEVIGKSSKKIKDLKIEDSSNLLPISSIFMGDIAKQLIKLAPKSKLDAIKEFQSCTLKAYIGCAKWLVDKMPFNNPFLKAVASLNPSYTKHSAALKLMKELPQYAFNVITAAELKEYDLEVHHFQNDDFQQIGDGESIDMWWKDVKISSKYPLISRLALALLTCFHGPKVESSFSYMNNIITSGSNRLNVSTFDAVQCVKYELFSQKKSAISMFQKQDFLKESVDPKLTRNFRNARKLYVDKLNKNKSLKEQRKKDLNINSDKALTKQAAKKLFADAAKKHRLNHKKKIENKFERSKNFNEAQTIKGQEKRKADVISKDIESDQSLHKAKRICEEKSEVTNDRESQPAFKRPLNPNLKETKTIKIKKSVLTIKEIFSRANSKNKK